MEKINVSGTFELMEYLFNNDCADIFGEMFYKDNREFMVVSRLYEYDYCYEVFDYMVENDGVELKYGKRCCVDLGAWIFKINGNLYYANRVQEGGM